MDGCFENGITASDDVSARQMGGDIGLDANTDELATVGETVDDQLVSTLEADPLGSRLHAPEV
jgi:hypothetical protein